MTLHHPKHINLTSFTQVIPRQVLETARGFAIYSVAKAGFVLSARAGSGIVIARLPDGKYISLTPQVTSILNLVRRNLERT